MTQNEAAWLDANGQPLRIATADMPVPGPNEIVVKNRALAINPVDWKIQSYPFPGISLPTILGTDVAGEVVAVGSDVVKFQKDDRVIAHCNQFANGKTTNGGFQLYSAVSVDTAAHVPASISFTDAVVLPLAVDTAGVGLYGTEQEGGFALPLPSLNPVASSKTIVIWGGSSSVGALTIQFAVASGLKVITVASPRNFDFVRNLGAEVVFDYNAPSIVDDVVKAVQSSGGDLVGIYDTISEPASLKPVYNILERLGGGRVVATLPIPEEKPKSIVSKQIFGLSPSTHPIWKDHVTPALEAGKLQCVPQPLIVGKGLGSLQKGLDTNKNGVSAKKVVIDLSD